MAWTSWSSWSGAFGVGARACWGCVLCGVCRAGCGSPSMTWREAAGSDRVFCRSGSLVFWLAARIVVALAWSQRGGLFGGVHASRDAACGGVVLGDAPGVNLLGFCRSTTSAFVDIVSPPWERHHGVHPLHILRSCSSVVSLRSGRAMASSLSLLSMGWTVTTLQLAGVRPAMWRFARLLVWQQWQLQAELGCSCVLVVSLIQCV